MIKAIVFDFGGVLMRTEDYSLRRAWDKRLGLPPGSVERAVHHSDLWVQTQLGRVSEEAYWEGVAEMLYMRDHQHIEALRHDYFGGDRLNYKLVSLIRELREKGLVTALLSNDSLQLETKLRQLDIIALFDHVFISAQMGVMKPDPTAYRVALQGLNVALHEAVFIDDSLVNIRGAQSLGLHAILFRADTDLRAALANFLDAPPA